MTNRPDDLRCPKCLGELDPAEEQLICRSCSAPYPVTGGIYDLRCNSRDYYFNPVPRVEMERLVQGITRENWTESLRSFVNQTKGGPAWLDNLVVNGRYAWKLLLDLNPDTVMMDLGCGLGNLTHNLAPFVRKVYALDLTYLRLAFSKKRFEIFNPGDDITLLAAGDGAHLPLRDDSLDCVVLSGVLEWVGEGDKTPFKEGSKPGRLLRMISYDFGGRSPREIQLRFLKEIRRVLKPTGQIFVAIENRLGYEYFTGLPDHHSTLKYSSLMPRFMANLYSIARAGTPYRTYTYSIPGHKRLFAEAGFPNTEFLGLTRGYSRLEEILPAEIDAPWWQPAPAPGLKERLRRNKYLVPAYGVIGSAAPKPWRRLQDGLLQDVEQHLSRSLGPGGALTIEHYRVTKKDKLLLEGSYAGTGVVLRLPTSPVALAAEQRNAKMLEQLADAALPGIRSPRPLGSGSIGPQAYFVEERLPGGALAKVFSGSDGTAALSTVSAVLNALAAGAKLQPFVDGIYEREVTRKLAMLFEVVPDPAMREKITDYFRRQLYGVETAVGWFHGDFGVLNVLGNAEGVTGLIDWEAGSAQGLPILDALSYLSTVRMTVRPEERNDRIVPLLASGEWPVSAERDFLRERYAALGMNASRHDAFTYLMWLHGVCMRLQGTLTYNLGAIHRHITAVLEAIVGGVPDRQRKTG